MLGLLVSGEPTLFRFREVFAVIGDDADRRVAQRPTTIGGVILELQTNLTRNNQRR